MQSKPQIPTAMPTPSAALASVESTSGGGKGGGGEGAGGGGGGGGGKGVGGDGGGGEGGGGEGEGGGGEGGGGAVGGTGGALVTHAQRRRWWPSFDALPQAAAAAPYWHTVPTLCTYGAPKSSGSTGVATTELQTTPTSRKPASTAAGLLSVASASGWQSKVWSAHTSSHERDSGEPVHGCRTSCTVGGGEGGGGEGGGEGGGGEGEGGEGGGGKGGGEGGGEGGGGEGGGGEGGLLRARPTCVKPGQL